jgi:transcriptional regulator with XRE-family HTH domain
MPLMTSEDVRIVLKKFMRGQSLRTFGRGCGLSAAYLSDVLRGNREPGPAILNILDLEKVENVNYQAKPKRKAGAK